MNIPSAAMQPQVVAPRTGPSPAPRIEETHWGYVLRGASRPPFLLILAQVLAFGTGAICVVGALGLWFVPGSDISGSGLEMKLGMTALLVSAAVALLWYASRGVDPEWQIDTTRGEVREVLRNRAGQPTVLARYGFDAIGGVVMDRAALRGRLPRGHACLVLRLGNSARLLSLIAGPETLLAPLRDRLGRDLIVGPEPAAMRRPGELRIGRAQVA